ncbi:hypothetical protein MNB_SV-12-204 [hydrothermal vent metagenome]|uniref:Uncharacterized protein n=1 Tax=hydrothermal vent metagenome TaxID=652676 RepID=A0A1W1C4B9_9ZZZZ
MYFLKNSKIKDSFTAKGLKKAKKEFDVLNMEEKDRIAYSKYQSNRHYEASMIFSSFGEGKIEGIKQGIEQERIESQKKIEQEKKEIAKKLLNANMEIEFIAQTTGLDIEDIKKL